jgi:serine/threonine-protein kinase
MIFGTPEYMSPEQAAGKPLDHRVDVYALAVIFFEMITGRVPFVGDTFMGILTQHMFEDPPPFEEVNPHVPVPDAITAFIYRGLAKDPDERYQTCEEMAGALQEALAGRLTGSTTYSGYAEPVAVRARSARSISATTVSGEIPMPRKRSSIGWIVGAIVVVMAAAAGGATVWYLGSHPGANDNPVRTVNPTNLGADAGRLVIADRPHDEDAGAGQIAAPIDAGPAMVNVDLRTDPGGAHVWVVGRGEVCAMTPCTFQTLAGQRITVRARNGHREGEAEMTPTSDTVMQLAMQRTGGGGGGRKQGQGTGGSGGGSGDLKIPDIFRPH